MSGLDKALADPTEDRPGFDTFASGIARLISHETRLPFTLGVHSADRLSRDQLHLMIVSEEFSLAGAELIFAEGLSGNTAEDKLVLVHPGLRWAERTGPDHRTNHAREEVRS